MKVKWYEEEPGVSSSMRLMSMMALLIAATLSFMLITSGEDITTQDIWLVTMWVVGAFAPKAVQKFAENEDGNGKNGHVPA